MSDPNELIIVGGGGLAREVLWLAMESQSAPWKILGFLDDNEALQGRSLCQLPVLGSVADCVKYRDAHFVVAVGSPRVRRRIVQKMEDLGVRRFATLVHKSVTMSRFVDLGEGCMVTAGSVLTTQVRLGRHVIVNLSSTVGHDVIMGDFCTLSPNVSISGNVTLEEGVELGTGALVIQGLTLARGSFIGAGAVVSKNIPADVLAVGLPARQIKTLEPF